MKHFQLAVAVDSSDRGGVVISFLAVTFSCKVGGLTTFQTPLAERRTWFFL